MTSKIEWLRDPISGKPGYTINPVKGLCPIDCKDNQGKSYCYARRLYKRFHWKETLRYNSLEWNKVSKIKTPSKIFVGSTIELFGDWIKEQWIHSILGFTLIYPQHTFIFLTKRPENLAKFSPFPHNAWVGVSCTNQSMHNEAIVCLSGISATIKFLSYEPLLSEINIEGAYDLSEIQWVIIGQQTPESLKTMPKLGWVEDIVRAADKEGIPVFLKDNLISCVDQYPFAFKEGKYRQEFPNV